MISVGLNGVMLVCVAVLYCACSAFTYMRWKAKSRESKLKNRELLVLSENLSIEYANWDQP